MSGTPQYPGPDPDSSGDPFDRPPDESGERRAAASPPPPPAPPPPAPQWTPPTGSAEPEPTAPITPGQMGYWEQKAADEQAAREASSRGEPGAAPPMGPSTPAYTGGYPAPPAPPAPPYGGYGQPPAYGAGYYAAPQPHPRSTTALVLGLIGLAGGFLCCLPLVVAPFAWAIGGRAKREIDASNGQLGGRGNAQAGYVMGIIGTVLIVVLLLVVVAFFVLVGVSADQYNDF